MHFSDQDSINGSFVDKDFSVGTNYENSIINSNNCSQVETNQQKPKDLTNIYPPNNQKQFYQLNSEFDPRNLSPNLNFDEPYSINRNNFPQNIKKTLDMTKTDLTQDDLKNNDRKTEFVRTMPDYVNYYSDIDKEIWKINSINFPVESESMAKFLFACLRNFYLCNVYPKSKPEVLREVCHQFISRFTNKAQKIDTIEIKFNKAYGSDSNDSIKKELSYFVFAPFSEDKFYYSSSGTPLSLYQLCSFDSSDRVKASVDSYNDAWAHSNALFSKTVKNNLNEYKNKILRKTYLNSQTSAIIAILNKVFRHAIEELITYAESISIITDDSHSMIDLNIIMTARTVLIESKRMKTNLFG